MAVNPPTILPTDAAGVPAQVKKIDFILNLKPDLNRTRNAFRRMPNPTQYSFNQTTDEYHRYSPIAVNIEVKKEHGVDPLVQLGIWCAAGFKKRTLDGDDEEIPMPCLAIEGHYWHLYFAYRNQEGEVIFLGPFPIGSTNMYTGIFQILECLTTLAQWAANDYQTWFERVVWKRLESGQA